MSIFHEAHHYIEQYGYLAVSLGIFLEDFGLPAPGETLLITGAVVAAHGGLDIKLLLLVAWIGAVAGDNVGFCIGHFGGHALLERYGGKVGITRGKLDRVVGFFQHYGDGVIVFARFVVVLRQLNGIVAGTLGMHWARFFLLNAIGAALWVGFWGLLAHWLGGRIFRMVDRLEHYEPLVIGLGVAVVVALVAGHFLLQRRRRQP
jgi:membrane protein DedA with SNARE-associated domain